MEKPTRILIVDDKPEITQIMIRILTHHGYAAVAASTGFKALEIAKQEAFDLIILDIELSDFNGFMTFSALKKLHLTQSTPVIFTSGTPLHEYIARSGELGGAGFIAKPFDATALVKAVDRHSKK